MNKNYINEMTPKFFNNWNKAILSNVEFFENMVHANTDAFERADFERKERKENLTAEQMDSLEIMNEPEITEAEFNNHDCHLSGEDGCDTCEKYYDIH